MQKELFTYRTIWRISYPIIIGLIAQNIMLVIDTAFLGRVSDVTLGAGALGGILYLCLVMLGTGFAVGAQIMMGRRNGEGRYRQIGRIFDHGIYFLILLAIFLYLLLSLFSTAFLGLFISSEDVFAETLRFVHMRKYGFLFGFLVLGFNAFYVGIARTKVLSVSTLIMAVVNIVLDYALIFGHWGFPEMGIQGAALATNIAELSTFVFYVIYTLRHRHHRFYRLFRFPKPYAALYKRLFRLASPVMMQYFLSFAAWFTFFLIVEQMGETALAASNITRSIYMLLMIPGWGLSTAVNTLVSNSIGQGRMDQVIPITRKILWISLLGNLVAIQFIIFLADPMIRFYTQSPELIETTHQLLHVVTFALIAFAGGMILLNALSGTGKTLQALHIEIVCIAFYLLSAFFIAVILQGNVQHVWMVEVIYFSLMGLLAFIVLKRGRWKSLTV